MYREEQGSIVKRVKCYERATKTGYSECERLGRLTESVFSSARETVASATTPGPSTSKPLRRPPSASKFTGVVLELNPFVSDEWSERWAAS